MSTSFVFFKTDLVCGYLKGRAFERPCGPPGPLRFISTA